jgi:hypothetical protein
LIGQRSQLLSSAKNTEPVILVEARTDPKQESVARQPDLDALVPAAMLQASAAQAKPHASGGARATAGPARSPAGRVCGLSAPS